MKVRKFENVIQIHKMQNSKPCVKVKLKNGSEIICTDDHEFYFKGSWTKIKDILSLYDGRDLEKDCKI